MVSGNFMQGEGRGPDPAMDKQPSRRRGKGRGGEINITSHLTSLLKPEISMSYSARLKDYI